MFGIAVIKKLKCSIVNEWRTTTTNGCYWSLECLKSMKRTFQKSSSLPAFLSRSPFCLLTPTCRTTKDSEWLLFLLCFTTVSLYPPSLSKYTSPRLSVFFFLFFVLVDALLRFLPHLGARVTAMFLKVSGRMLP
jgi:hypothetical protein